MKNIDEAMAENLHALTTIRLAGAINPEPRYIKRVVKGLAKKMVNKRNAKMLREIYKHSFPLNATTAMLATAAEAYAEYGVDWQTI